MTGQNIGNFKGYRSSTNEKIVTFDGQSLDSKLDLFNHSRVGMDWGYVGSGSLQLSFAMLFQISDEEQAKTYATEFSKDIVSKFDASWEFSSKAAKKWLAAAKGELFPEEDVSNVAKPILKHSNVVKQSCQELNITQKKLAQILEVPEGTVSSWAVRNELPRLAKKAIEFYIQKQKNEEIVKQFRTLISMVS
ncbi:MAG: DUF6166 domain-containing protein [Thiovulaceae bacterium]|nr:DUF6166 domain-containing protein [Sulfurimonadaceae bacterium]